MFGAKFLLLSPLGLEQNFEDKANDMYGTLRLVNDRSLGVHPTVRCPPKDSCFSGLYIGEIGEKFSFSTLAICYTNPLIFGKSSFEFVRIIADGFR